MEGSEGLGIPVSHFAVKSGAHHAIHRQQVVARGGEDGNGALELLELLEPEQ